MSETGSTAGPPTGRFAVLSRIRQGNIWKSIFRQGYPNSDESRALAIVNSFFLHIHPVTFCASRRFRS